MGAIETTETRASKERLINLLVQTFATNCCKIAKNEKNNKHDMQIKRSSLLLINASKQNTNASKWETEHDSCLDKWSSFMELVETIKYHLNTINEHCPMLLFYPATTIITLDAVDCHKRYLSDVRKTKESTHLQLLGIAAKYKRRKHNLQPESNAVASWLRFH